VGARTSIGGGTVVESLVSATIGDDCFISHALEWQNRKEDAVDRTAGRKERVHVRHADVVIGPSCWIGTRCIVLKGVHLAEGTVLGAGSVVTKSCPPYSWIAGNPVSVVRSLDVPEDAVVERPSLSAYGRPP